MMGNQLGRGGGGPAMYGVSGHGFGGGMRASKVKHGAPSSPTSPSSPPPAPTGTPRTNTRPSSHGTPPHVRGWDEAALIYVDSVGWCRWSDKAARRGIATWRVVDAPTSRWSVAPVDMTPKLRAIASRDCEKSQGAPVARVVEGVLYMFSLDWTGETYALCARTAAATPVKIGAPPGTLGRAAPTIGKAPHPPGGKGLKKSVDEVIARVVRDADDPFVIAWARQTIHAAQLPEPRGYPDPTKQIRALFEALKKKCSFVRDGVNREVMASTRQLLCLDPKDHCIPGGDCDEAIIALMATARAIGIPVRVYVCFYKGMPEAHIMMLFDADTYLRGKWTCFDPSTDGGACPALKPEWEYLEAIDMDAAIEFNGLGSPPPPPPPPPPMSFGDPTTPATTSTTTPTTLTAAQTSAWVAQLTSLQGALASSTSNLQNVATQYAAFRQSMQQPANDPVLTGDNAIQSGNSNLAAYMSSGGVMGVVDGGTGYWTAAAAQQETQLLAAGVFMGQCISDALAGKRALTWDSSSGDLDIASAPGDTMRINMVVPTGGATSTPVPMFLDPATAAQVSTVGFIQIPIAVGVALAIGCTVVTIYAVKKVMDYLAEAHQQDMLQTVVGTQQQLIASGQSTPQASTDFLNAAANLATATNPNPPASAGLAWWEWVAIAAVAAGGGWAAGKFL